jgi:membrane protein required for beta-lactamase induction
MYFIDYIPVRLTSYTFSVISNYDNVIERINNLKLSNNNYLSNIEFINQVGDSVYDSELKESEQIIQIQNILARTLIAWVSAITLLSIAGILV